MRSTLDESITEPTRAQLEAYYRKNAETYAPGEAVSFDHVFFSFGSEPADQAALLANLRGVLEAAGSSLDRALKVTVFMTDLTQFQAMNAVYGERFPSAPPARRRRK